MSSDYDLYCETCQKETGIHDYHLESLVVCVDHADLFVNLAEVFAHVPEDDRRHFFLSLQWDGVGDAHLNVEYFKGHLGHAFAVYYEGSAVDLTWHRARRAECAAQRAELALRTVPGNTPCAPPSSSPP